MGAAKSNAVDLPSSTVDVLLSELREECERVAALIQRLENRPDSTKEKDELFRRTECSGSSSPYPYSRFGRILM